MDDVVDRTPKPMIGVKTQIAASWKTDDTKASFISGTSDNAFDQMSCLSFDIGTATGNESASPVGSSSTSPSPKPLTKVF